MRPQMQRERASDGVKKARPFERAAGVRAGTGRAFGRMRPTQAATRLTASTRVGTLGSSIPARSTASAMASLALAKHNATLVLVCP